MAAIEIRDLEMNAELDNNALQNLLGGKWIKKTFVRRVVQRYTRRFTRRIRVISYRYQSYYRTFTRVAYQRYTRWVWV